LKTDSPDEGGSITQASPEFDEDQGDTAMRVSQIRAAHQELMAEYTAVLRYRAHTNLVYPFADLLTSKQTVESHIARTLRDLHVAYIYASQAFQTNESARQWFDTTIQSLGRIQSTLPKEPDWQRTTRYGRILWGAIIALSGLAVALAGDQIWGAISNSHSIKSLSQDFTGDEAFALTMQTIALVLGLLVSPILIIRWIHQLATFWNRRAILLGGDQELCTPWAGVGERIGRLLAQFWLWSSDNRTQQKYVWGRTGKNVYALQDALFDALGVAKRGESAAEFTLFFNLSILFILDGVVLYLANHDYAMKIAFAIGIALFLFTVAVKESLEGNRRFF